MQNTDIQPEYLVDMVYHQVTNKGRKFYLHTDGHTDPSSIGCGHVAKATQVEHARSYGVFAGDVKRALVRIRDLREHGRKISFVTLPGDHKEQAVLMNLSTIHTVAHSHGQQQFFVYDATISISQLKKFAAANRISPESFVEIAHKQVKATLDLLARGKNVFTVDLDGKQPIITYAGTVT